MADVQVDLFDRVPERLFSVLASPGRRLYAHALFSVYDLFRHMPFGLPKEVVIDAVADGAAGEAPEVLAELGDEAGTDPRARALALLRRFREDGWLDVEVRSNYEEYVTVTDHASKLLETLDRIRTQRRPDYMGFVYLTYAALSVDEADRQGGMAIERAREQTEQLVGELKVLHHNIRRYTEDLARRNEPRQILSMHFLDYKAQVLDRSYHLLRTSDHVSKYRPRILERVGQWLDTPGWVATAAHEQALRTGEDADAVADRLREALQFVRTAYSEMDAVLDEIDRRNAQYAKASFEQVRYLLSGSEGTEGHLVDILAAMAVQLRTGGWRADEPLPDDWAPNTHLYRLETLSADSLYRPRHARFHVPAAFPSGRLSEVQRQSARRRAAVRLRSRLTPAAVDAWVQARMRGESIVRATDLDIESVEDFVRLIHVGAFGRSSRVGFAVEYVGEVVSTAGARFSFRNLTIRRR